MKLPILLALSILLSTTAVAQEAHHDHKSAYAGEETRSIKSLSDDDLSELRRGGGWGFAKAAELNGMPGPFHVLKMADQIALDDDQKIRVRIIFENMQREAIVEGARYISLEEDLEAKFRKRDVSATELKTDLVEIEESRARLRFAHLSAHLMLLDILTEPQVDTYNRLRGYKEAR